ncbi:type A chloramphenicol O-acetyltransferase [Legionella fallonii]|uniref:Chloramphenicol acetyltransferase n=1 Tax=Legionella fallonii LLAP-10 TaxID=1212491 RepID=A0A098FZT5_9GAMM|nr:type A chloramphenicol O-acetyltransferase [Legionella fallonii]CEG55743.1 Chloramphenicol acetyltransferase [Legionella fallonii LLAP-10]
MKNDSPLFNVINLDTWPRKPYFDHYSQQVKCTYSLTIHIDIGKLLSLCKKESIKLYPVMIYLITTAINQQEELRIDYSEQGELGIWNFRSPCYTLFHDDDKTFSNLWTPYNKDFSAFYLNYLTDMETYGATKAFTPKEGEPGNTFPISCVPWLDFTAFNLNIYDDARYLAPIITIGKYTQQADKVVLPIAAQLHHAVCDGYHAGMLFELIKKLSSTPEEWINL